MATIHRINDGNGVVEIECGGSTDCRFCREERNKFLKRYLNQILFKPRKVKIVKRIKKKKNGKTVIVKRSRIELREPTDCPDPELMGKSLRYICTVSCKNLYKPCYICIKNKCKDWHKYDEFKGQDPGCPYEWDIYCLNFICDLGVIDPPTPER